MPAQQILVIDDDDDIRETIAEGLSLAGLEVHKAKNGQEGLGMLRDGLRPCLILLDLIMPVMNGWAFSEEVARDPAFSSLRVCIISATGLGAGQPTPQNVVAMVKKPIHLDKLLEIIGKNGC